MITSLNNNKVYVDSLSISQASATDSVARDTANVADCLIIQRKDCSVVDSLGLRYHSWRTDPSAGITQHAGVEGKPVPYRLRNDTFVTATLILCLLMACFVVSRSMHALGLQIKGFFRSRDRNEDFSLKSEGELRDQVFVVLLESFVLSLLFFSYTQFALGNHRLLPSPYLLLLADMGICVMFLAFKYLVYKLFNWTFFSKENCEEWFDGYNLIAFVKAASLLVLSLLVVYFDLPIEVYIYVFLTLLGVYELLVLYKTRQIFFRIPLGFVPSFLYFCTLEIIPLLFLWEVLVKTNEFLII